MKLLTNNKTMQRGLTDEVDRKSRKVAALEYKKGVLEKDVVAIKEELDTFIAGKKAQATEAVLSILTLTNDTKHAIEEASKTVTARHKSTKRMQRALAKETQGHKSILEEVGSVIKKEQKTQYKVQAMLENIKSAIEVNQGVISKVEKLTKEQSLEADKVREMITKENKLLLSEVKKFAKIKEGILKERAIVESQRDMIEERTKELEAEREKFYKAKARYGS